MCDVDDGCLLREPVPAIALTLNSSCSRVTATPHPLKAGVALVEVVVLVALALVALMAWRA